MHICFITSEFPKPGFPHGGVGTFVGTLGKALVKEGVQVSVIGKNYIPKEEEEVIDGIKVYRLAPKKVKGLEWFFNAKAIARKIDEVHQENPIHFVETPELGLAFLPKRKGIQYVIRMHGGHHYFAQSEKRNTEWWKAYQERKSFKKADAVIAVSNYVGETTRKLLNLGDRPIEVIYNPIDTSRFFDATESIVKPYSVLFAGSLVEKKGVRQLVEALAFLADEYPQVELLIAGRDGKVPGTGLPYRPILEQSISEKIRPHIKFLGVVPNHEMPNVISKAHVCCYPSHMEAMPLAWLEVLAMGKIFVGSLTGPRPEAVRNGETGILVNPHDPKEIAKGIKWVFENQEQAKKMGKKAIQDINSRFALPIIVKHNISYFKSLL